MKLSPNAPQFLTVQGQSSPEPLRAVITLEQPRALRTVPTVDLVIRMPAPMGRAVLAALGELRTKVGGQLEGAHRFAREESLTLAAAGLGTLYAAFHAEVGEEDPNYAR